MLYALNVIILFSWTFFDFRVTMAKVRINTIFLVKIPPKQPKRHAEVWKEYIF
jgi:hypothetical protein